VDSWERKEIIMLEKVQIVDRIEVVENGCVQVRTKTAIMEDGKPISGNFSPPRCCPR
jgi:hypothetical protein